MNSISQKLNEDQLAMVEQMGGTGFCISEIAEVIEEDPIELQQEFSDKTSLLYKRYRKGYLKAALELRQRIFKDAGYGSSPAQTLAKKIMDDADFKIQNL